MEECRNSVATDQGHDDTCSREGPALPDVTAQLGNATDHRIHLNVRLVVLLRLRSFGGQFEIYFF